jgi:hypothetical protein
MKQVLPLKSKPFSGSIQDVARLEIMANEDAYLADWPAVLEYGNILVSLP